MATNPKGNLTLDVAGNRQSRKWSRSEIARRILWMLVTPFFRLSPRPMWSWRRQLLRLFGARIGNHVHIYPNVRITIPWNLVIEDYAAVGNRVTLYALGTISIGSGATVSQGAHLCAGTHDYNDPTMPLLKQPISIGVGAWICADAFIGPGVRIAGQAIVGARAVVMKDVESNMIVAGNPARFVKMRELSRG